MARSARFLGSLAATLAFGVACGDSREARLERAEQDPALVDPDRVPVPPEDGPELGVISALVPVRGAPAPAAPPLGTLRAGARVRRSAEPVGRQGCPGGWYAVRPRGFVCAGAQATTDLDHPTLTAMALGAARGAPLPYPYARAVRDTELLAVDPEDPGRVVAEGLLRAESGLAIVGSWTARGPSGESLDLALGLDGRFVATRDLSQVEAPQAPVVTLGGATRLPLGIVIRRGAARLTLERSGLVDRGRLPLHSTVALSGEARRVGKTELLSTRDGELVRARDVVRVEEPRSLPPWAEGGVRWLDVDLTARVVLAFDGTLPVRAALLSAGAPPGSGAAGELRVTAKAIARLGAASALRVEGHEVRDAPWTLDLSDGRRLVGAYWHGRFGGESRSGAFELAPSDARFVFDFVGPELPAGWHGVVTEGSDDRQARVRVR